MADRVFASNGSREVSTVFADAGVTALERLQEERTHVANRNASLWAWYGNEGTWKEHRDNLYSLIELEMRATQEAKGKKITDAVAEAMARTDKRYTDFIAMVDMERAAFYLSNNEMKKIDERERRDDATIRLLARV